VSLSTRVLGRALAIGVPEARAVSAETGSRPLTLEALAASARDGSTVSEDDALKVSAVFAAVSLLSETIAALPVDVFERRGLTRHEADRPAWLDRPNAEDLPFDVMAQTMTSLLLRGNAFWMLKRDTAGRLAEVFVLDPDRVSVERRKGASGVSETRFSIDGGPYRYTARDVLHLTGMRKPGAMLGLSPIAYAAETIGVSLSAQRHTSRLLTNFATPGALVEVPGTLSEQGAEMLARAWKDKHSGPRAGGVGVLTEGAKLSRLSLSSVDAQLLETRRWQIEDVARVFRTPVHLLGESSANSSWGAGVAEQGRAFVTHSLRPWLSRLEAHTSRLAAEDNPRAFVRFNVDGLMRGDTTARYGAYESAIRAGWLDPAEVRALEDLPPRAAQ
jgi:HK97 family phage portal protein